MSSTYGTRWWSIAHSAWCTNGPCSIMTIKCGVSNSKIYLSEGTCWIFNIIQSWYRQYHTLPLWCINNCFKIFAHTQVWGYDSEIDKVHIVECEMNTGIPYSFIQELCTHCMLNQNPVWRSWKAYYKWRMLVFLQTGFCTVSYLHASQEWFYMYQKCIVNFCRCDMFTVLVTMVTDSWSNMYW